MKVGEIMKYKRLLIFISFLFIMLLSTINVNASDNVKIKSIDLVDKSVNTTEVSNATFNGLEMNFDLKFMSVDDYAKYKVVVQNSENKDYKISIDSNFGNSKYIAYDYVKADSLKANFDTEFYVIVSYKNEVNDSDYVNEKYNEKNSAVLKLSNDSDSVNVSNPITSNNIFIIIIGLIILSCVLFILFRNNKNKKLNIFVLFSLLSIPLFVKAVDSLKITINSNVSIEKGYAVDYEYFGYIKASELENYDLSKANCRGSLYVGNVSEENRYVYCSDVVYKTKKKFTSGSEIGISDTELPDKNYFPWDDCTYSDGSALDDDMNDSMDFLCPSVEKEKLDFDTYSYGYYSRCKKFGYQMSEDDITSMKFNNVIDMWDKRKKIFIKINSTFIMPNHDVLFNYSPPE